MLDSGFNGCQLPAVPRVCRSPRGKVPNRKKFDKIQRHEFEMLAWVAEKYLEGRESDSVEQEDQSVSNLLDTMEMDVEPFSVVVPESNFSVSLSRDWLALAPSMDNSCIMQEDKRISSLKSVAHSKIDRIRKPYYENGTTFHDNEQPDRMYPFKKRKFFNQSQPSNSGDFRSEDMFTSSDKKITASQRSSSTDQQANSETRDRNVKFNIKSFKIPELYIDIPVSATIGSLKTTVMEAVTAILKDGLHVGIVRQGKKVRDDSKTLAQTGICWDDQHLGFTLEPGQSQITPSTSQKPKGVAERNEEALSVVSVGRKSGRAEIAQRRIRRPFTVSEVETLVQAVEKLGTGRWRDVKSCAFEDENHRTYVDLKDKWKTLVHTARISPWQRRGEPVPQELLDRVLVAHAFWSEHQAEIKPAV